MELKGKRALITGGTLGIGAAIAVDLAAGGADVVINARTDDTRARETLQQIEALGRRHSLLIADMADGREADRCVDDAVRMLGGLDILVHSAGGPSFGRIEDVTPEQWEHTFAVHVHAAYRLCRRALPVMRQNNAGAIILVSSAGGIRGCPNAIAYGTAKGAIVQFTRMLARDVADDNIRVNCVAPGIIRTRFHDAMTPEQKAHNLSSRIPLHREGTVEEVAQAVRLLVTNDFITGETVVVDGGTSMQITR
jgi:NAD(P)-dependent dehydrogenase (short-subunit alcohol dehydrogenase family)